MDTGACLTDLIGHRRDSVFRREKEAACQFKGLKWEGNVTSNVTDVLSGSLKYYIEGGN